MKIYERLKLWSLPFRPTFLLLANFRQIPTWKIWFQPIGRIFHEKYGPNLPDFEEKKFYQSPDFQYIAKNVEGFWFFSTSILVHVAKFGYITLEMIATLVTSQNWKKKPWFGLNSLAPQTNNILLMSQQTWSHELKKRSNFPLLAPKTFLALTPSLKRALSEPTESCKSLATGTQFH